MFNSRFSLITIVVLVTAGAGCNRPSAEPADAAPVGTAGERAEGRAEGCEPLETREPNAPDQRPAFPGQTRACATPSNVAFDVVVLARGLRASVGGRAAARRRPARDREAGPPADRLGGGRDRPADRGRAGSRCARPGRPARRRAEPGVRRRPHDLLELRRAATGRQRDQRRARRAVRRPPSSRTGPRDLSRDADLRRRQAFRLAARVRPRRHAVRHARRALRHADAAAGAAARQPPGQDPAHQPGRLRAARQPVRRTAPARCPKSGRSATATCRRRRSMPRGGSGWWSTARRAATS